MWGSCFSTTVSATPSVPIHTNGSSEAEGKEAAYEIRGLEGANQERDNERQMQGGLGADQYRGSLRRMLRRVHCCRRLSEASLAD